MGTLFYCLSQSDGLWAHRGGKHVEITLLSFYIKSVDTVAGKSPGQARQEAPCAVVSLE